MNDEIVISVNNLSKVYRLYDNPKDRLKESLHPFKKKYHRDFYALRDVSFTVKKGESLGIMGKNGSGKSTLLKILSGVLTPSSGAFGVNGKISSLLELGTGFNPDLTGIENVYFNGAILGFSKEEMDGKLDDVLAFADIGDFVKQPVKTYSSGMFVRLAFAVAISVNPDVLIVDEALAVGDASFQAKCYKRLEDIRNKGTSLILVTHSVDDIVKHCNRALFLKTGQVAGFGIPREIGNMYLDDLFGAREKGIHENNSNAAPEFEPGMEDVFSSKPGYRKEEYRWGQGGAVIIDFLIRSDGVLYPYQVNCGDIVDFFLKVRFDKDVSSVVTGILVKTLEGIFLYGTNSFISSEGRTNVSAKAGDVLVFRFSIPMKLNSGNYLMSFGISEGSSSSELIPLDRRYDSVVLKVHRPTPLWGIIDLEAQFEKIHTF